MVTQDYPANFTLNTNVSHLNLEYDLPWFTVKSVTAYQYLAYSAFELQKYEDALEAVNQAIKLSGKTHDRTLLGLQEAITKELKQREALRKGA